MNQAAVGRVKNDAKPLLKAWDLLRESLEALPVGIIIADQNGKFQLFNSEAEKILGVGAKDVLPGEWTTVYGVFLPDKVTPCPAERLPLARALRGENVNDELVFIRNTQRPAGVWIRVSATPFTNGEGLAGGGVVTFYDVTELRDTLEKASLLSEAVEQTADTVIITDVQGVIEYVNPAFETTTGYSCAEALGGTPRILKSGLHDAEFYKKLWQQLLDGHPFRGKITNQRKNGEHYLAEQTITPMKNREGRIAHFVSVLKDITEVKQREEQELQLRLAHQVQQRFYAEAPCVTGFDIGAASYAALETGGDYFDFIPAADGCLYFAVGDVSGHGFSAALVMALTRAYLRSSVAADEDVGMILTRVNRNLCGDLEEGRFVTLFLARLDPRNRTLSFASAGHVPGFLLANSGRVARVMESTGLPLGLYSDSKISCVEAIPLHSGEVVLLLTDGVTESNGLDGTQWGTERAIDWVSAHRNEPARQIVSGLYEAARAFAPSGPQADDITAVVLKVNSAEH